MNARLRKLPDGSGAAGMNEVCWFDTATDDHSTRKDFGEIYWPFALHWGDLDDVHGWRVTHLPSGQSICARLTKRAACGLIRALRAIGAADEWQFTKPQGAKGRAMKTKAGKTVRRYRRLEKER